MVINISRWKPLTCDCLLEVAFDYDTPAPRIGKFLLLNEVCDDHWHLATTVSNSNDDHKRRMADLSPNVLNLIEVAKNINLTTAMERLKEPKIANSRKNTRDQLANIEQVKRFNEKITEEWQELVERTHAFDIHIHDIVKEESDRHAIAHAAIMEHFMTKKDMNVLKYDDNGNLVLRPDRSFTIDWEGLAAVGSKRILHMNLIDGQGNKLGLPSELKPTADKVIFHT